MEVCYTETCLERRRQKECKKWKEHTGWISEVTAKKE